MRRLFWLWIPVALLAGCAGGNDGELSKKDDQQLRYNFARSLTPEEIAHMNSAKPAGKGK